MLLCYYNTVTVSVEQGQTGILVTLSALGIPGERERERVVITDDMITQLGWSFMF